MYFLAILVLLSAQAGSTLAGLVRRDCTFSVTASSDDTCASLSAEWGITEAQFVTYNPSVGASCANGVVSGQDYCVEMDFGAAPTTTTSSSTISSTTTSTSSMGPSPTQTGLASNCVAFHKVVTGDTCSKIVSAYNGAFTLNDFSQSDTGDAAATLGIPQSATTALLLFWDTMFVTISNTDRHSVKFTSTTSAHVTGPTPTQTGIISTCDAYYKVASGDSCQSIVNKYKTFSLSQFYSWNPAVGSDCSTLFLGYYVCVGVPGTPTAPVTTTGKTTTTTSKTTSTTATAPTPTQTGITSACPAAQMAPKATNLYPESREAYRHMRTILLWSTEGDAFFNNTTLSQVHGVLAPKVTGTINLHHATMQLPLDFFLMTSSIVGTVGAPSQGAYAAANTFQDAFARSRHAQSLPATALALGLILEVGSVSASVGFQQMLRRNATYGVSETEFLQLFEGALCGSQLSTAKCSLSDLDPSCSAQVVTGLEPTRFVSSLEDGRSSDLVWFNNPRFQAVTQAISDRAQARTPAAGITSGGASSLSVRLQMASSPTEKLSIVREALTARLAELLSLSADDIETGRSLSHYGVDSLVAGELRSWLIKTFGHFWGFISRLHLRRLGRTPVSSVAGWIVYFDSFRMSVVGLREMLAAAMLEPRIDCDLTDLEGFNGCSVSTLVMQLSHCFEGHCDICSPWKNDVGKELVVTEPGNILIGKYEEAEQMHRETLELYKSVLGLEHPSTLDSIHNLALVLRSLGKYEEAEQMHRETLELKKSVLDAEHPSTKQSEDNLGRLLELLDARHQGSSEQSSDESVGDGGVTL
ncbi:putative Polyketide synthase [Seiridium unicorne]|uniref:Polyketide synthase n=1 Tax=Seiridium unicorne TaxID=138068 RepID=A0ABR2V6M8_9PEZI